MTKRQLLPTALLAMALSATTALANPGQTLTVNGEAVAGATVTRITFDGDNAVLTLADGTTITEDMAAIVLDMDYTGVTTSIATLRNPVDNMLTIDGLGAATPVAIYDAHGRIVARATASTARTVISTAKMPAGVYVIKAGNNAVKFIKR